MATLPLIVYREPGIDAVLLRTENMSRESVTISCIVTDPMQLSREPFYDDHIKSCIASFTSLLDLLIKRKEPIQTLNGQVGTRSEVDRIRTTQA